MTEKPIIIITRKFRCDCGHEFWTAKPVCQVRCPKCKQDGPKMIDIRGPKTF